MLARDARTLRCPLPAVQALGCVGLVAVGVVAANAQDGSAPVARADENSRIAHAQLVEKARRGNIDVYFAGDSITRRWGTSDAAYRHFLDNWTRNFYGWNAANFGWGGDTVQNVLWRLIDGELDGVHPKVIVLMAGTNNVGGVARQGIDAAVVERTANGMTAILDVLRAKAPEATVILMGITPRTDSRGGASVMPTIDAVNARYAGLAEARARAGQPIRYLNINARLARDDGGPREGVTVDGLHLSVAGYQAWADALAPILLERLGPRAAIDRAPPATGDPEAR